MMKLTSLTPDQQAEFLQTYLDLGFYTGDIQSGADRLFCDPFSAPSCHPCPDALNVEAENIRDLVIAYYRKCLPVILYKINSSLIYLKVFATNNLPRAGFETFKEHRDFLINLFWLREIQKQLQGLLEDCLTCKADDEFDLVMEVKNRAEIIITQCANMYSSASKNEEAA